MGNNPCLKIITLLIFSLISPALSFSDITKEEALLYRERGYEAQRSGDFTTAFTCYEKAIAIDPTYAIAYNDLGVLYERKGNKNMAKRMYQRALEINPSYAEVYYNIACLYESEGDFLKAAFYWKARLRFGRPESEGTLEARERLRQIGQIYPQIIEDVKKEEARFLSEEIEAMLSRRAEVGYIRKEDYDDEAKKLLLEMERQKSLQ